MKYRARIFLETSPWPLRSLRPCRNHHDSFRDFPRGAGWTGLDCAGPGEHAQPLYLSAYALKSLASSISKSISHRQQGGDRLEIRMISSCLSATLRLMRSISERRIAVASTVPAVGDESVLGWLASRSEREVRLRGRFATVPAMACQPDSLHASGKVRLRGV